MAREQVAPDFAHTTFSVRILKVGCESLALQPSCGEGVLRSWPHGPQPHVGPRGLAHTHRDQDVLAVALKHKALPVKGDHVALPIEAAGGWAVGALLAGPRPVRAGAVEGAGCPGVWGMTWAHAPHRTLTLWAGGAPARPKHLTTVGPPGSAGGAAAHQLLQSVWSSAPRG